MGAPADQAMLTLKAADLNVTTFWTPRNLAAVTRGNWVNPPEDTLLLGLSIDSRTLNAGQVYLAIKGERLDGHGFLDQAFERGASCAITQQLTKTQIYGTSKTRERPILIVDNTVHALQSIAAAYRIVLRQQNVKVIAVTGSNGKSTTRHLIHTILSARLNGTQAPKSFNNHIGVPLTLLGASVDHNFVVVEIGMNRPGEIDTLARLVRPDAAVITNFGTAHLGNFESPGAIVREKCALLQHIAPGGLAVVPDGTKARLPPDVRCTTVRAWPVKGLPLLGEHNRCNARTAIEIARWMGIEPELINRTLPQIRPLPGRLEPRLLGELQLIDDSYNANPQSVIAAMRTLVTIQAQRRVAILGDMLELGEQEVEEHYRIGQLLAKLPIQAAILIGPRSARTAEALRKFNPRFLLHHYAGWTDELPDWVSAFLKPRDAVLIKASRNLGLERLIPAIEKCFGRDHDSSLD